MTVTPTDRRPPLGDLLRTWRERRRLSQLELANRAEVSARHLSFIETGRSRPSREMIAQLAERLEVPLRERNRLLLAAGYAPAYGETDLDAPELAAARDAVRRVLAGHEPYPAVVVDRRWQLLDANPSLRLFTRLAAPDLLVPPVNVLRVSLHPEGLAPHILNLGEWRSHLLGRLTRQVELSGDVELAGLLRELRGYPCAQPEPVADLPGPGEFVVPLRIRSAGRTLSFFSTVATFGTPLDVTLAELVIESFYPADRDTVAALRAQAAEPAGD
ncbi:helix-turn-helix domain-containing protein [Plantactinospora sp. GCM10030261]|uniref:helix-turn-helix domain-containing protein n=1 Tax=Plantactinospora sp. GCM10030261 TaxID=3273420 RepID=UPI00360857BF